MTEYPLRSSIFKTVKFGAGVFAERLGFEIKLVGT
jgi:hypothetical protein